MSGRARKGDSGIATRLLWMIFSPFEFAVSILVGVPLFLGWAIIIYLKACGGLFERAVNLLVWRFRIGPISSSRNERKTAPPLATISTRDQVGRENFASWLN